VKNSISFATAILLGGKVLLRILRLSYVFVSSLILLSKVSNCSLYSRLISCLSPLFNNFTIYKSMSNTTFLHTS
jgi:hypothetical protein